MTNQMPRYASGSVSHKKRALRSIDISYANTLFYHGHRNLACYSVSLGSQNNMSSTKSAGKTEHKTKKFGKSERTVPHHTQKAKKFYPAEDDIKPRKVGGTQDYNRISSSKTLLGDQAFSL